MTDAAQNSRAKAWDRAILLVLAAAWVLAMACIATGGHDFNSDGATAPLQANDILHGNVFLSGWSAPMDQFYTLDIAFSTLLTAIWGLSPAMLALQSFIVLMVVGIAAFGLARSPGAAAWITAAVLIVFFGWPTNYQTRIMFGVIAHIPTLACALLGMLALSRHYAPGGRTGGKRFCLAYGVVLFLAAAGDPFTWYIAGLPFLAAGAVVAWRGRDWRPWRWALLVTLAAGLAAKAVVLILQGHGFQILDLRSSFRDYVVAWNKFPFNLYLDGRSWLTMFGWPTIEASPKWLLSFGGPATFLSSLAEFFTVVRILGAGWAVAVTLVMVRKRTNPQTGFIDYALLAGFIFNHASFITSSLPEDDRSARYLLPSFVYLAILTTRRVGPLLTERLMRARYLLRPLVLATLACLLAPAIPWLWTLGHTPVNVSDRQVTDWLQRHGLHRGYADYWQANVMTLLTGGKVQVAQTEISPLGPLASQHWNSKADWYREPANFYICLPDNSYYRAALVSFGPPSEIEQVGRYRVMIWNHDIQSGLRDFSASVSRADLPLDVMTTNQLLAPGVTTDAVGHLVDEQPRTEPAIIIYGPYIKLPVGRYLLRFVLNDTEAAPNDTVICEATIQKGDVVLNHEVLTGADFAGAAASKTVTLAITSPGPDEPVEFRVWKSGKGKLTLLGLTLNKD